MPAPLYTDSIMRRFLRTTVCALCSIGLLALLFSCKTAADRAAAAAAENRISELLIQLNENQSQLAAANLRVQEMDASLRSLPGQIAELEEKETKNQATIKDLTAQKAKLEQLLAEVQIMQLSAIVSIASSEQVAASNAPPARAANPAESGNSQSISTSIASTTTVAPRATDLVYGSSLSFTDTAAFWPREVQLEVKNNYGTDRTDRKKIPGTPLFSERDTVRGIEHYFHRDHWYQEPGLHIEIANFSGAKWGARLVVVGTATSMNGSLGYVMAAKNGAPEQPIADLGVPDGSFALSGFEVPRIALWYQLSPSRMRDLYRALEQAGNVWRVSTNTDQSIAQEGTISLNQRKILLDMLAATKDLTATSAR